MIPVVLAAGAACAIGASAPAPRPLIIGVLSYEESESSAPDSVSRDAERGLRLGLDEAEQTARLFGRDVREKRVVIKRGDDATKAARIMARTTNMSALLVTNPELIAAAESVPGTPGQQYAVVVMRTLPSATELDCSHFSFDIYPSEPALDSVARRSGGGSTVLWSPTLERFGALELNDRYRARWKTGMTGAAWASWLAVKIFSEASLRTQSVEPFLLLDYIRKSEFDGHKGWPLTFRAEDHLLRQPLYVVARVGGSKVDRELPGGTRSETEPAAQVLDSILPPRRNAGCATSKR